MVSRFVREANLVLAKQRNPNTGDAGTHDAQLATLVEELIDVMERVQQQLGQINNNNNLEPGERFE